MSIRRELFELDVPGDEEDLPQVQGDSHAQKRLTQDIPPGTVVFSMEQLGALAVAVLVLVVIAFLVGRYVSKHVEQATEPSRPPEIKVVENVNDLLPDQTGKPPLPDEYSKPFPAPIQKTSPETVQVDGRYTLEVIRFLVEDRALAVATQERLQKYGYAPVFLQQSSNEISVCVGRFENKDDKKGNAWRDEIRGLRSAYRHCDYITVK